MSFDHADGWVGWMYCAPVIGDAPVQIMRDGWDEPSLIFRDEMWPEMNVAGLYWRRTGIYREREAGISFIAQQQANALAWGLGGFSSSLLGNLGNHGR